MIFHKTGRLDIRAKTADGMQIEIKVQINNQKNMDKRTLFYWGKLNWLKPVVLGVHLHRGLKPTAGCI